MTTNALATIPSQVTCATSETMPLGFDTSAQLAAIEPGLSPTSPVSVLVDDTTDAVVVLADPPTITGDIITQIVRGSVLVAGHRYSLSVTYTAATDTVLTMVLRVWCPQ